MAALLSLTAFVLACASGCSKTQYVLAPDSPVLVTEGKGQLRISALNPQTKTLIDLGWMDASQAKGLTLVDYDWTPETTPSH